MEVDTVFQNFSKYILRKKLKGVCVKWRMSKLMKTYSALIRSFKTYSVCLLVSLDISKIQCYGKRESVQNNSTIILTQAQNILLLQSHMYRMYEVSAISSKQDLARVFLYFWTGSFSCPACVC